MESGRSVMELFRSRGWTTIITDYMLDTVLFMVNVGVALITGLCSLMLAAALNVNNDGGNDATLLMAFLIGFVLGYALCAPLFSVVSSAVNTVIVLYAEAPNEFQSNHREHATEMLQAWRQAWPSEFKY
jgi:hypothetical protein